jgi:hypothetical protein
VNQQTLNIITNIIGFLLFILEPVRAYLEQNSFNIWTFLLALGAAVVAYFSNKITTKMSQDFKFDLH